MDPIRHVARPLLAGIFISGGLDALRHPAGKAGAAATVTDPLSEALDLDLPPEAWVRVNGAVQVAAGLALSGSVFPRFAALALAGSLAATTVAGHRFWEADDRGERKTQQIQFLKNAAIIGGLLETSLDRGGRSSLLWRVGRQVIEARESVHDAVAP